ncbi:VOC family protein [Seonamhaeicola maritimus]|uniref:VOC family protein n=1 Tax=Seonamhaeicola maritimus TaxID=2591822 RepID=UPI0024958F64|nr:VOC family protein [Seonamhaeicola maritimus]
MKKLFFGLFLFVLVFMAFRAGELSAGKGLLPNQKMLHVGIIVEDINSSLNRWVKLLGLETVPEVHVAEGHHTNPTHYKGKPSDAKAKLVFIKLDNIQIELIEPIGETPSHWKNFLDQNGEGVHHFAFEVEGMGEHYFESFNESGMPILQHGGWNGGEYGYMDSVDSLAVTIELIEDYNRKK